MKKFFILLFVLTLLTGCSEQKEIIFGTGDVNGKYNDYGTVLSECIEQDNTDITFKIRQTAGSAANLRLLDEGYLDIAFVQSDTLRDAYNGTGLFNKSYRGYSAIAGLYTEVCQLVVAADSEIETVDDLYGKKISLGEKESGVLQNAKQIMLSYGLDESMIDAKYLSFTDSANEMKAGKLDGFFCTAGEPTLVISVLAQSYDIRLIPIAEGNIERILKQYDGYTKCIIKANTYKGQDNDIQTIGVKTVLVANNKLSAETVEKITEGLFNHSDDLSLSEINADLASKNIPIPFHEGAARYYGKKGISLDIFEKESAESVPNAAND